MELQLLHHEWRTGVDERNASVAECVKSYLQALENLQKLSNQPKSGRASRILVLRLGYHNTHTLSRNSSRTLRHLCGARKMAGTTDLVDRLKPNKTNSMSHTGDTHQMKMEVFSQRVSLGLTSSGAKILGRMLVTDDD